MEKEGRIIAGSFVWLAKKGKNVLGVCFDSVEALTAYKERPELFSIYKQVVLDLNKIYPTITFGMNNFSLNRADRKLPIPLNVYSDARVQFVLNENQNSLY